MQIFSTLAVMFVFAFSLQQCDKTSVKGNENTAKAATNSAETKTAVDEAPRISLDDAKKAFDAGNVLFIDTRSEAQYKEEHIKGAINIPADAFETRYAEVPKDKKVIAYCSWPAEHTSARAVQTLKEKGYTNAFALLGGTAAWKNAGYPMEGEAGKK